MKNFFTLLFAALSFNAFSQNNAIHVYPWNPDANQDNSIGMGDLLSFLSVFGNDFGLPPEPCDYDGTPLEDWFSGIISGDIMLDSLFVEFQLLDSSEVFYPGCPEPVMEVVEINFSEMLTQIFWSNTGYSGSSYGGQMLRANSSEISFYVAFHHSGSTGFYHIVTRYLELSLLGYETDGLFGTSNVIWSDDISIPFDEIHSFNENGLFFDSSLWGSNEWPYYANYLHILPYWHYADE